MAAKRRQAAAAAKTTGRLKGERLFLKNGSCFTIHYAETKHVERDGAVTRYEGVNGVFLGEARESEVAFRVSLDMPMVVQKVPASAAPNAPLVDAQTFPAGSVDVATYIFPIAAR